MNNHANAQAVVNALELKDFLGQPVTEDLNPELIKRYPELKKILPVVTQQTGNAAAGNRSSETSTGLLAWSTRPGNFRS